MNGYFRTAEQAMTADDMMAAGAGVTILAVWMILIVLFCVIVLALIAGMYVLTAIPIHKMARRAGVPHAWLAWVPIGQTYVRLKLSKREFNIFNWIKIKDRNKAFEVYLWIVGGIALLTIFICVMAFVPFIQLLAILLYYVMIAVCPVILGIFIWRVNYDILMSYGLKEHAMWVSVLYYWCPYFMIYMTYKIMNSDPVGDMEASVQRVNSTPVGDMEASAQRVNSDSVKNANANDKKENTAMGADFKSEFFYPVELGYFAQKLRMIGKTDLKMQYKEERPLQNGLEVKLVKDMTLESWGENITVTLTGYSNGTHIRIHSACSNSIQLIDWGVNEKNIRTLFRYFEHGMPGRPAPKQP